MARSRVAVLLIFLLLASARDFITGRPGTPAFTTITSDHLHNLFVGGGITLHF